MVMLICTKQHLRNIKGLIYEKVKQHWDWVEKNVAYKKKACIRKIRYDYKNQLNLYSKDSIRFGIFQVA